MGRPINQRSNWAMKIQASLAPHFREAADLLPEDMRPPLIPATPETQKIFMRLFLDNAEQFSADTWHTLKSNPALDYIRKTQRNLGEEFDVVAEEMTAPKPVTPPTPAKKAPAGKIVSAMKAKKHPALEAAA